MNYTDERLEKKPCTKCGSPTYLLFYVRKHGSERLVCVDCFADACKKADKTINKKALTGVKA